MFNCCNWWSNTSKNDKFTWIDKDKLRDALTNETREGDVDDSFSVPLVSKDELVAARDKLNTREMPASLSMAFHKNGIPMPKPEDVKVVVKPDCEWEIVVEEEDRQYVVREARNTLAVHEKKDEGLIQRIKTFRDELKNRLVAEMTKKYPSKQYSRIFAEKEVENRFHLLSAAERLLGLVERANPPKDWPILSLSIPVVMVLLIGALTLLIDPTVPVRLLTQLRTEISWTMLEALMQVLVFVGVAIWASFWTFRSWKRWWALLALHKLRALAHVVEMHHLDYDPLGLVVRHLFDGDEVSKVSLSTKSKLTKSCYELNRYLTYCGAMLSIIAKTAALYIQDFRDPTTRSAVEEIETLCMGMSDRIGHKFRSLDAWLKEELEEKAKPTGDTNTKLPPEKME